MNDPQAHPEQRDSEREPTYNQPYHCGNCGYRGIVEIPVGMLNHKKSCPICQCFSFAVDDWR